MDSKKGGNAATDSKSSEKATSTVSSSPPVPVSTKFEVNPNAGKYITSIRSSETTNVAAIEDVVDNCIDAGASVISISTKWKNLNKKKKTNVEQFDGGPISIVISDNGKGMNKERLIEAFRLGAISDKTIVDIGSFGCGMKESILSLAKKFTVYTRYGDGIILVGVYDLDHMVAVNKWEVDIHKADFLEVGFFEKEMENMDKQADDIKVSSDSSGTVIKIEEIDRFTWKQETSFIKALTQFQVSQSRKSVSSMPEVYRVYLNNENIRIFVNNKKIESCDPIRDYPLVCPLSEETIQLPQGNIYFTIAELDTADTGASRDIGIGFFSRGFYVMRNDRQIMAAEDIGVLPNRNNVNNLRVEMRFSPEMDEFFQTSRYKNHIIVEEELRSKIGTMIAPYIKRVSANNDRKSKARSGEKLNTSKAEKRISQKVHLLKAIKGLKKEKRDTRDPEIKGKKKVDPKKNVDRKNIRKVQPVISGSEKVEFIPYAGGKKGPMFKPDYTNNGKIRISLNEDHPIYSLICLEEGSELMDPTLFVFFCMGREELNAREDHNSGAFEAIENLRWDMGRNMSTLLV